MSTPEPSMASLREDLRLVMEQVDKLEIRSPPERINNAIESARACVEKYPQEPAKGLAQTILLAALRKQYEISTPKDPSILDEAVEVACTTVENTIRNSPDSAIEDAQAYFTNLAHCLSFRFKESKDAQIEDSIKIVLPLLNMVQEGSQYHAFTLEVLSSLYSAGYHRTKSTKYLDAAIDAMSSMISILPENHPHGAVMRQRLAKLYDLRFENTNVLSDLDNYINTLQQLRRGQDDVKRQFNSVSELSHAFERRYKLTNQTQDLEKAIEYSATAVKISPRRPIKGHPITVRDLAIHNLRVLVKGYFIKTETIPELEDDVLQEGAIIPMLLSMDRENNVRQLQKVATCFQKLYEKTSQLSAIQHALRLTMGAMQEIDDSHAEWGDVQDAFKIRFRLWSEHTGKMPDCEITILAFERNGGTYIPPEMPADLGLRMPYMIYSGELPVE